MTEAQRDEAGIDEFAAAARGWTVARPGLQANTVESVPVRLGHRARRTVRTATAGARMLPSFLIIGAQKAGTSSLWDLLSAHPGVARSEFKEPDYFNWSYFRSLRYYGSFFPRRDGRSITGEASPDYLYDPRVPERVARDLPGVKLVVLLRDPVDRAISHYHHQSKRGLEGLEIEAALDAEPRRLRGEYERLAREPHYRSMMLRHFSYVDRGRYADQLERWMEHVDREQLLILPSEPFFADPATVYARVLEHLELPPFVPADVSPRNAIDYVDPGTGVRDRLAATFAEPNERLFSLLGERFDWTSASAG